MDAEAAARLSAGRRMFREALRDPGLISGTAVAGAALNCALRAANYDGTAIIISRSRERGLEGGITVLTKNASFNFNADLLQSDDLLRSIFVLRGPPLMSGDKSASFGPVEAQKVADLIQALEEYCGRTSIKPKTFVLLRDLGNANA